MLNKLVRQSLKPWRKMLNDSSYKEWLKLFDHFNQRQLKFPATLISNGINWTVHHGPTFLNQYESIFLMQIYKFNAGSETPVIIDCGANMGTSVLYFKKLFPYAKILAFEPDPFIFNILKLNVGNNNLTDVTLINKAVWNTNEELSFNTSAAQSGRIGSSETTVQISGTRLNDHLQQFSTIDFLKLDIEGAELIVLQDISDSLLKVKHLFIEYHSFESEPQQLSSLLKILETAEFRYFINGNELQSPFTGKHAEEGMDLTLDIFAVKN